LKNISDAIDLEMTKTPDELQTDDAAGVEMHNDDDNEPGAIEVQNYGFSDEDADLSDLSEIEDDLTEWFLDTIQQNWNITKINDIIADDTWMKGETGPWDIATIEAFQRLSELTKGKASHIKSRLKTLWNRRDKNHGGIKKGIGRDWKAKQPNLRQDIEQLIQEVQAEKKSGDGDIGRSVRKTTAKDSSEQTSARQTRSSTRRSVAADIPTQKRDESIPSDQVEDNDDLPIEITDEPQSVNDEELHNPPLFPPHEATNLPASPAPPNPSPTNTIHKLLKSKLQRSWNLADPACSSALPTSLRPQRTHAPWTGPIEHWGCERSCVLKNLCKLANLTRGRHAEVVQTLKDLVSARLGTDMGTTLADLDVACTLLGEMREGDGQERGDVRLSVEEELGTALSAHCVAEAEVVVARNKRDIANMDCSKSAIEVAEAERAVGLAEQEVARAWVVVRSWKRALWELQHETDGDGEDEQ
jgi:hypothetical protein